MRTVLVAVKPLVLRRQYRQVPILGDLTSLFFYEGEIQTMRELPAQTCPLTVVVWDSDSVPDEIRVSSLEAGLVIKLHDHFHESATMKKMSSYSLHTTSMPDF